MSGPKFDRVRFCSICDDYMRPETIFEKRVGPEGKEAFCSEECSTEAELLRKVAESPGGAEWAIIHILTSDGETMLTKASCEDCADYQADVCEGGGDPVECAVNSFATVPVYDGPGHSEDNVLGYVNRRKE